MKVRQDHHGFNTQRILYVHTNAHVCTFRLVFHKQHRLCNVNILAAHFFHLRLNHELYKKMDEASPHRPAVQKLT